MINCPKCSSEVLVATPALGNIPLDVCPGCSGIWFEKGELEALLKQSQGGGQADLRLIEPRPGGHDCPSCKVKMSRGGLVNPLLLVEKCETCGGVWLDANELALVKKLLGLAGADPKVKVDRPAAAPAAPPARDAKLLMMKLAAAVAAVAGLVGVSYEMYLYFSPAEAVSRAPSMGVAVVSVLLFAGGVLALNWGKEDRWR